MIATDRESNPIHLNRKFDANKPATSRFTYHSADHDELRAELRVNGEHVEDAEAEEHMIESKDDACRIETRAAGGCWNKAQDKTRNVRPDREDVDEIPMIRHVAEEFQPDIWRIVHCDLCATNAI